MKGLNRISVNYMECGIGAPHTKYSLHGRVCVANPESVKKTVTPEAKRKAVVHLINSHQVSQRRACDILQVDRSSVRYQSKRGEDAELRDAIKRVARDRRRFGYRRINVMLQREGKRNLAQLVE